MVRVWNFILPESGEHSLRVENIGTAGQRVFLDGNEMECQASQESFTGPDGVVLRISQCVGQGKTPTSIDKEAKWALLVDDQRVEEADPSGAGLRDLRSMAEGSYIIATGFDAEGVVQNALRKYKFIVDSVEHELDVAHRECVWQVSLDGKLIDQQGHTLNDNSGTVHIKIPGADGALVPGTLQVTWELKYFKWNYCLVVGGIPVPPYWTKAKGLNAGVVTPAIFSASPAPPSSNPTELAIEAKAPAADSSSDDVPEVLPQGVSYDRETKTFQANIQDCKTKRYICLGEFASADDAHQKYLEALSRNQLALSRKQLAPLV